MTNDDATRVDNLSREGAGATTASADGRTPTAARHTPGPWTLDDACLSHVIDEDYHGIGIGHRHIVGFMTTADARLIASAPDLVVAATSALAWCDQGGPADWSLIAVWRDALRAALAKAQEPT